jgi:hypothetical protein
MHSQKYNPILFSAFPQGIVLGTHLVIWMPTDPFGLDTSSEILQVSLFE